MSQHIEFYYDIASPFSYLAWHRLNQLVSEYDAQRTLMPVALADVFAETGNLPPSQVQAKAKYLRRDIDRYANRYRVNFTLNPHFPIDTNLIMRVALVAQENEALEPCTSALFEAMWSDGKNLADESVIKQVLEASGLSSKWVDMAKDERYDTQLNKVSKAAVDRGIFGVPTMFANGEMLFGQDRIWVIDELLGARSPF